MAGLYRSGVALIAGLLWLAGPVQAADAPETCANPSEALGVSRIVEIDTTAGPLYGDMSKYVREESFLGPKEIVLTFDDGPMPWITKSILDTLDRFCTKATFFSVGQMALAYPNSVKDVLARGHTLGTHTWSHPLNIARLPFERARDQIDRGFAAVSLAAGEPIAPFFRFPGLSDSNALLAHLQSRGIAAFTVDVVSNDSFIRDAGRLTKRTIQQTDARNGGILLFHDIKASTAKALPEILTELRAKGYKVVHMRPKAPLSHDTAYDKELAPKLAKAQPSPATDATAQATTTPETSPPPLKPFYGSAEFLRPSADTADLDATGTAPPAVPVTALAPEARPRGPHPSSAAEAKATANADGAASDQGATSHHPKKRAVKSRSKRRLHVADEVPPLFTYGN